MHLRALLLTSLSLTVCGGSFLIAEEAQAQCPTGLTDCGGQCVDLQKDEEHCGQCGETCPPGYRCVNGSCTLDCQDELAECNGLCVDLANDENNCGQCGEACPPGHWCVNGSCVLSCPPGQTQCGSRCVDMLSDEDNCGACNESCAAGESCVNGTCVVSCQAGLSNCGGVCVDLSKDEDHCGQCGQACPDGYLCENGNCVECRTPVAAEAVHHGLLRAQLRQNAPNPFNPRTTISYSLTEESIVSLQIYDMAGRLVRVLEMQALRSPGEHMVTWDGRNEQGESVASGVYVYRLNAGDYVATRVLTLLK